MRRIAIGLAVLLVAAGITTARLTGFGPGAARAGPAPEFTGIARWLNSEPLSMRSLRGKVVLVDFWTYSCVNCVRTFPHLRAMAARYGPFGLQIVGVHSPEFDFEKDVANVRDAVERYRLPYPIAMDNDMATWRAYRNRYWPHVYVVDAQGVLRFDHIGEGGEDKIQDSVRTLLARAGATLPEPLSFEDTGPSRGITPEIYAGYERGSIQGSLASIEGYHPGDVTTYRRPDEEDIAAVGANGGFFLEGSWRAEREYVEATAPAQVLVPFRARDVFMVAARGSGLRVLIDGAPVRPPDDEARVAPPPGGMSPDLYHLARFSQVEGHRLVLEVPAGFRLYTFTFG